jgi:hypothetical protein
VRLNQHNIEKDDAVLNISSISVPSIRYQLEIGNEQESNVLETDFIKQIEVSSLMLRARYSVNNRVEEDRKPDILLYQLSTNIYARFILILIVLLESARIYALLLHYTQSIRNILFGILVLGFVTPTTAIISSSLAIYLTVGKMYNAGNFGIISAMLFAVSSMLSTSGRISSIIPTAIVFSYAISIAIKQIREKIGLI